MRRMIVLLTGALLLLIVGNLSAVQTPSSLMRMSDLANQSGALTPSENNAEDYLSESTKPISIRSGGNYDFNNKISHKLEIDGGKYASDADHVPIPTSVPEPTTLILIGLGLAGAGILRRKR